MVEGRGGHLKRNIPQLPCGKALYSYEGKEPGDLKFNKGDIIILRRKVDENWYHGELNGSHGFLPASYIQCIKPLSQTPPQGKALYDFEVKDKDQDKDCLTFTKSYLPQLFPPGPRKCVMNFTWEPALCQPLIHTAGESCLRHKPLNYWQSLLTPEHIINEAQHPAAPPAPSTPIPPQRLTLFQSMSPDEILTVIRRVDDNWAEGMLGDKIGIFPILYVELNETAKQLMEVDKPTPVPGPSSSSDPGPPAGPCTSSSTSPPGTAINDNGSSSASAIQRRAEGKKNAKKRHSFTALSMTQRTAQALNNRHSMEISAPVLISSSDPRAAARIGDCPHLSSSAPPQDTFGGSSSSGMVVSPRVASVTGELLAAAKVQLPLNIYLAMYAYKPQKADELELRKGEMYRVMEKCQDGWFKGTSLRSGASGVFPGNYVTPVSRAPFAVGQARACLPSQAQVQAAKVVASSSGSAGPSSPVLLGSSSRSTPPLVNPSSSSSSSASASSSPQLQPASVHLKNCLRMSGPQTVGQARTAMQLVHSPPAASPERPTAAVSPLRPQGSPSRSPGPSGRPLSMVSPQHSLQGSPLSPAAPHRSLIPLTSAAAAITPPNVSAAHLNGSDVVPSPLQPSSPGHAHTHAQGAAASLPKLEEKKAEKKEKKGGGLLKLLSGAAAKKKSRSPPSVSPTHEPHSPAAAASEALVAGAMGCTPDLHPVGSHGRAGSCPIESEMQGAMGMEPLHRKSGSLDLNFSVSPPARQPCSSLLAIRPEPKPLSRERYRVVVPYPPQSEAEIELKEGDIVFVHKKREDGWYKGTLQRTGRTGLFPGSFVEIF
ncbi:hypothetical protein ACEWY4_023554 [Coilia grayii]|uniref:RING-type E3 ubiquitin transferase n=1 Tax=Coilia grayii TaxID=363190 RepID=A0ABD1J3D9_9TELE